MYLFYLFIYSFMKHHAHRYRRVANARASLHSLWSESRALATLRYLWPCHLNVPCCFHPLSFHHVMLLHVITLSRSFFIFHIICQLLHLTNVLVLFFNATFLKTNYQCSICRGWGFNPLWFQPVHTYIIVSFCM